MKQHIAILRDWTKSNWRVLLTMTALVGILIRVEIGIGEMQRQVREAERDASRAQSAAEDAESQASSAKRVAEDAKSDAESALAEVDRVERALRRLP